MSRRLYQNMAHSVKIALDRSDTCSDSVALVARSIAEDLKMNDQKFRYDKFFEACGLDNFGYVEGTKHSR